MINLLKGGAKGTKKSNLPKLKLLLDYIRYKGDDIGDDLKIEIEVNNKRSVFKPELKYGGNWDPFPDEVLYDGMLSNFLEFNNNNSVMIPIKFTIWEYDWGNYDLNGSSYILKIKEIKNNIYNFSYEMSVRELTLIGFSSALFEFRFNVIINIDDTKHEINNKSNMLKSASLIEYIPTIMYKKGWINGAKLMDRWFKLPENSDPEKGTPCTDIIKMDWVLKYDRAKKVYDKMISEKVWVNDAAKREIQNMLKTNNLIPPTLFTLNQECLDYLIKQQLDIKELNKLKGMTKNTEHDFLKAVKEALKEQKITADIENKILELSLPIKTFNFNKNNVVLLDNDYIQYRGVGDYWDMATGSIDDLRAALARFVYRIVVAGEVAIKKKESIYGYKVRIKSVGVYVRDSYDFNDPPGKDQTLGYWDSNDLSVGRTVFSGQSVHNSDFRQWRNENLKGGDFLVYSDIKEIILSKPDVFWFEK